MDRPWGRKELDTTDQLTHTHTHTQYWSFSFNVSPSNEYSGLIAFVLTGLISLLSKGHSRVFSSTAVQKNQFFGTRPSLQSSFHICM